MLPWIDWPKNILNDLCVCVCIYSRQMCTQLDKLSQKSFTETNKVWKTIVLILKLNWI